MCYTVSMSESESESKDKTKEVGKTSQKTNCNYLGAGDGAGVCGDIPSHRLCDGDDWFQ